MRASLLAVFVLAHGCAPVATNIAGTLEGRTLRYTHAYYGVVVSPDTQPGPERETAVLFARIVLTKIKTKCERLWGGHEGKTPLPGLEIAWIPLEAGRTQLGAQARTTGKRKITWLAGRVRLDEIDLENLPDAATEGPWYPLVEGRLTGSIKLSLMAGDKAFDGASEPVEAWAKNVVGRLRGVFAAEHCPQLDRKLVLDPATAPALKQTPKR